MPRRALMRGFSVASFALALALSASAQQQLRVVHDAPMFLLPDAKRQPLTTLTAGTVVDVLGTEGTWLNITLDDPRAGRRTGYIEARYTNRSTTPATRTTSQAGSASARQPNPVPPTQTLTPSTGATSSTSRAATPPNTVSTISQSHPTSPP